MALPTVRQMEQALQAAGCSRTQARRAISLLKAEGLLAQEQPEKSGLIAKLRTALSGK